MALRHIGRSVRARTVRKVSYHGPMRSDEDKRFRDALVVGSLLAPEGAAAYGTAMHWWGWTARADAAGKTGPAVGKSGSGGGLGPVTFITPKRKQAMRSELLGVRFELVLIKPERMFGAVLLGEPGLRVRLTERERTVIDMFDRSDLCGGIPAAAAGMPPHRPLRSNMSITVRSRSVRRTRNPGSPSSTAPNMRSGLMNTSSKRTPRSSGRMACLRFGVMKVTTGQGPPPDPAFPPASAPSVHPHQCIAVP